VRAALAALVLVAALLGTGCAAIVVEPTDESATTGAVKFWGYTLSPGEPVRLEAQSTSWELLASATSSSSATHSAGSTGYYFEVWYYPPTIASRFRKTSPYAGYFRAVFRLSAAGGVASTRQWAQNTVQTSAESWLHRFWLQHTTSTGNLRIDVRL
jgi:hypothetical protein